MALEHDTLQRLAERIAARIFTNGAGDVAERLVLELKGGKDGGGWGRKPVVDLIAQEIAADPAADVVAENRRLKGILKSITSRPAWQNLILPEVVAEFCDRHKFLSPFEQLERDYEDLKRENARLIAEKCELSAEERNAIYASTREGGPEAYGLAVLAAQAARSRERH